MSFTAVGRVVPATFRTTTGTQDFTSPGVGTPKGVVVIASWSETLSDTVLRDGGGAAWGCSDGTRHRAMWYAANDGAGTQISGSGGATNIVCGLVHPQTGADVLGVTFSQWIPDGVRLNVAVTNGDAFQCLVILLGGSDVECFAFDEVGLTGSTKVTTGFLTSFVLTNRMKRTNGTTAGEGRFDPGIATRSNPADGVCCVRVVSDTGETTAEGRRGKYSDRLTQLVDLNEGFEGADLFGGSTIINNYVSDGFDVQGTPTEGPRICGLAVKWPLGVALDVDEVNPGATGTESKTFPGFRTGFVYAAGSANTNDNALQNGAGASVGAGDFISQRAAVLHDQNNVTTTNSGSMMSDALINVYNGSAATRLMAADLGSRLSNGFELDWDVVDAANPRRYIVLALENDPHRASFAATQDAPSGTAAAKIEHRASFAGAQDAPSGTAAAKIEHRASFAGTQDAPSGTADAEVVYEASFAGTQDAPSGTAAAKVEHRVSFAGTQDAPVGTADAEVVHGVSFAGTQDAPAGSVDALAGQLVSFAATQDAPSGTATAEVVYEVLFAATQEPPSGSAAAVLEYRASFSAVQAPPIGTAAVVLEYRASFSAVQVSPTALVVVEVEILFVPGSCTALLASYAPFSAFVATYVVASPFGATYDPETVLQASYASEAALQATYRPATELLGEVPSCD